MVKLTEHGGFLNSSYEVMDCQADEKAVEAGRARTMAYGILKAHNQAEDMENLCSAVPSLQRPTL